MTPLYVFKNAFVNKIIKNTWDIMGYRVVGKALRGYNRREFSCHEELLCAK